MINKPYPNNFPFILNQFHKYKTPWLSLYELELLEYFYVSELETINNLEWEFDHNKYPENYDNMIIQPDIDDLLIKENFELSRQSVHVNLIKVRNLLNDRKKIG